MGNSRPLTRYVPWVPHREAPVQTNNAYITIGNLINRLELTRTSSTYYHYLNNAIHPH